MAIYATGSAITRQQEGTTTPLLLSVDASNSGNVPSQSTSISRSSTLSSSALLSSAVDSISGPPRSPTRRSVDDTPLSSLKMEAKSGQKPQISTSSVTQEKLSPPLSTSASLRYYYYSPVVMGESTNSILDTPVVQQPLAETPCAVEVVTSPEVASGTSVDATTATATTTNDGLAVTASSLTSGGKMITVNGTARQVKLTPGERPQLTSGTHDVGAVKAVEVVNVEARNADRVQERKTCSDDSRQTASKMLVSPSGELAGDSSRFTPTHQMAALGPHILHYGLGSSERIEQVHVDEVSEKTLDNDPVHLHLPPSQNCNKVDLATAAVSANDIVALQVESISVLPDDVFPPEQVPSPNNGTVSIEPGMPGIRAVPEAAATVEKERPMRLVRQDSFNRPDSPMFHRLMELPRDSVILRNRRHRRRRLDSNVSSSSTSSSDSSSKFLSNSRRSVAPGTAAAATTTTTTSSSSSSSSFCLGVHFFSSKKLTTFLVGALKKTV